MSGDSPEAIKKHVKTYWAVGGILFFFTIVTVAVSTFSLPIAMGVLVALTIAGIKGGFVASIFMHLNHERKIIYQILAVTIAFFIALMALPILTTRDQAGRDVAPPAQWVYFEGHDGGHDADHGEEHSAEHAEEAAH